jgi:hypothetical protein
MAGPLASLSDSTATGVPQFAIADAFLEDLAVQGFARLGGALAAGACLRALRPYIKEGTT